MVGGTVTVVVGASVVAVRMVVVGSAIVGGGAVVGAGAVVDGSGVAGGRRRSVARSVGGAAVGRGRTQCGRAHRDGRGVTNGTVDEVLEGLRRDQGTVDEVLVGMLVVGVVGGAIVGSGVVVSPSPPGRIVEIEDRGGQGRVGGRHRVVRSEQCGSLFTSGLVGLVRHRCRHPCGHGGGRSNRHQDARACRTGNEWLEKS